MRVFVAEKPSVAEAIAKQLSRDAKKTQHFWECGEDKVTWCFGHLLEMASPEDYNERYKNWAIRDLPVVPEHWKMRSKGSNGSHLSEMKKLLTSASLIVNAGDPDREGQLVVDEILQYYRIRTKVQRLWLNAVDPASIKKALASLEPNEKYHPFMETALGRQRADWLIGMNLSRFFTTLWTERGGKRVTFSVGRVQTPTLALIVARDKEITAFNPHDYFTLQCCFKSVNGEAVQLKWVKDRAESQEPPGRRDQDGRIIQRSYLDEIATSLQGARAVVEDSTGEEKTEHAPLPFSLSELQKLANKRFGYSPKQVLDGCQALYEKYTLTTYPRTDCGYLKESQHAEAPAIFAAVRANMGNDFDWPERLDPEMKSKAWNDKKVTAHHGIIPTVTKVNLGDVPERERRLYGLIVNRYLAQFLPPHVYIAMKIVVLAGTHQMEATARAVKKIGWRVLEGKDEEEGEEAPVVDLDEGEIGHISDAVVKRQTTKPPERFTGATLIDAMKNAHRFVGDDDVKAILKDSEGIGTEATRADTIDGLVARFYIEEHKKGKKTEYRSTVLGEILIDFLPKLFTSPELTAYLETRLADVGKGNLTLAELENVIVRMLIATIEDGKEGIGLDKMDPSKLSAHQLAAIEENSRKIADAKANREKQKGKSIQKNAGAGARPS